MLLALTTPKYSVWPPTISHDPATAVGAVPKASEMFTSVWIRTNRVRTLKAAEATELAVSEKVSVGDGWLFTYRDDAARDCADVLVLSNRDARH